ncbi:hypothetical protein D3C86_1727290 [compost metagenome]
MACRQRVRLVGVEIGLRLSAVRFVGIRNVAGASKPVFDPLHGRLRAGAVLPFDPGGLLRDRHVVDDLAEFANQVGIALEFPRIAGSGGLLPPSG